VADSVAVRFLEDGRQPPEVVEQALSDFCAAARASLDIAIYDCGLRGSPAEAFAGALNACAQRGVAVRLAYYAGPHPRRGVVPPPHDPDSLLGLLSVATQPIQGYQALMHHKYIVRDAGSRDAAVWTGSTNWTNDAWGREENIILQLASADLAALYAADFAEMWSRGHLENSGKNDGGDATLEYAGAAVETSVWFSPGLGIAMAHAVAQAISAARQRIVIATPVLTVGSILGALSDRIAAGGIAVSGVYDRTQMDQVRGQWAGDPHAAWKIPAFDQIVRVAGLAGKRSTPYAPGSLHDYMHAKAIVIDDQVFTGSYNFSHSGEENAENLLALTSAPLADLFAGFIQRVSARYASDS
jgi:phosphatidylserine/phosphatidylglycerophosphate/cardiolipin synthase-like enzyme